MLTQPDFSIVNCFVLSVNWFVTDYNRSDIDYIYRQSTKFSQDLVLLICALFKFLRCFPCLEKNGLPVPFAFPLRLVPIPLLIFLCFWI